MAADSTQELAPLITLAGFVLLAVLYLLPTIVAGLRARRGLAGFALRNVRWGWTGIGWLLLLIQALSTRSERMRP